MAMEMFFTSTYRWVELFTAADVVQHSFIVQKSISSLNLELSQCHKLGNCAQSKAYYPSFSYSKDMINTEEKCRKIYGEREILYNLHLDMPVARESRLKYGSHLNDLMLASVSGIPTIQIYIGRRFYCDKLFQLVEYVLENNRDKLKILKWLIEFDVISLREFLMMPRSIVTCIADCIHPGLNDSEFVTKCLMKVDFDHWIRFDRPERLANILYQVNLTGRKPEIMLWCNDLITRCFFDVSFRYICEVMKFLDAPKFGDARFKESLVREVVIEYRELYTYKEFKYFFDTVGKRQHLQLLVLWFYIKRWHNRSAATNSVRLVWHSIPDSFLTIKEMMTTYEAFRLSPEETAHIYNFYCQAVGEVGSSVEPRSLQHYCRTTIRRILWENNRWLPEGIGQTGLPPNLQTYLNLQK